MKQRIQLSAELVMRDVPSADLVRVSLRTNRAGKRGLPLY
jgi:hypothetical protein